MRIAEIVKELVSIDSVSGNEMNIQKWIGDYLKERGFKVELQEIFPQRPNLYARRGESNILFASHADTVPQWGHPNAFTPLEKGDLIYGRGAVDTKGQIASLLKAVDECDYPCEIAIFIDEEKDGSGSQAFNPHKRYDCAIVLEPTELKVALGEMGGISFEIEVKGKSAHGSTPYAGKNAIEEAFKLFEEIKKITLTQENKNHSLKPWINLGKIEGGRDSYVVPDYCKLVLELSILPGNKATDILEKIQPLLHGKNYIVKDLDEPIIVDEGDYPFKLISLAYQKVGMTLEKTFFPSWSDAHNLSRKGIPSIIIGAGKLELAHTPYEFVNLRELETLKEIIKSVIQLAHT